MSKKVEAKLEPYVPPKTSWRLLAFIEAPLEEIEAKIVECKTCPVFLLCEAGSGGTGWTCQTCKTTGVHVDVPENGSVPKDVLSLDCQKHKFETRSEAEAMPKCALCSGEQMELEVLRKGATTHYIATKYAAVPVAERQKALKEHYRYWREYYSKKKAVAK